MREGNYECFSYPLMKFILQNGIVPIDVNIHHGTKKTMWVFERTENLSQLLDEWSSRKKAQ